MYSSFSAQYLLQERECQETDSRGVLVVVQALVDLVSLFFLRGKICYLLLSRYSEHAISDRHFQISSFKNNSLMLFNIRLP